MSSKEEIFCKHGGICGGCPWILLPYAQQMQQKKQKITAKLETAGLSHLLATEIQWESIDLGYLRDRADLSIVRENESQICGLYDLERKKIVDMQECKQMSLNLWKAFLDLKKNMPPVNLGSVRLRVGPQGEQGLWLDFSNLDIKKLLDEKNGFRRYLKNLRSKWGKDVKP